MNPTFSLKENTPGENGSTKPAQESLLQCDGLLENTAAVTVGSVCKSQETGERQATRTGRNRRNKKRTSKTAKAVTEGSGSAAEGTALLAVTVTTELSSIEQPRAAPFTENQSKKELSLNPTSPERDEQCSRSSRKSIALPVTAITEKQEEEKWEVKQLILDHVTETAKELGHAESLPTKECLGISHQEADTKRKGTFAGNSGYVRAPVGVQYYQEG